MPKNRIRAAIFLAAALVVPLVGCSPDTQEAPSAAASTTASPAAATLTSAAPSPRPSDRAGFVASLELPVAAYPDVKSLATAMMADRYTAWKNQGATQENNDEFMDPDTNKTAGDFAEEKILKMADVFPEALYIAGYENVPSLVEDAAAETKASMVVLERRLITWDDDVPYKRSLAVNDVTLVSGSLQQGEVSFNLDWTDSSNAADNRIATEYDPKDTTPYTGNRTITAVVVDGKWKISRIEF